MSAPVAYTARSLITVGLLVAGMALVVTGLWFEFGWPIGLVALGVALIASVLVGGKTS